MTSILLTGASGYVGGQVLRELVRGHPEYAISALVRDATAAANIAQVFPSIRTVVGDLDDGNLVEKEASQASVVLHVASNRHLESVQAIHRGLQKRSSAYWIQISGASALAAGELASGSFQPGEASDAVFDDLDGISSIRTLIKAHEKARAVDNYVLDAALQTPSIKTALVLPPIIYGKGQGPIKQRSVQIPELARVALERGRAVRVGRGLSRWGNVHVGDIARLFYALAEAGAEGKDDEKLWGENGIYLTGVGEINWAEISERVAQAAKEQGLLESTEVEELHRPDADTVLPHGSVLFGTNARSRARRAAELLGWKPTGESIEAEIPRAVAEEASKQQ
ncbi:hypothetical protein ACJZ2D_015144 [Fusarium nematophilum]